MFIRPCAQMRSILCLVSLLAFCVLMAQAGCRRTPSSAAPGSAGSDEDVQTPPPSEAELKAAVAANMVAVPVIYDDRLDPVKITELLRRHVLTVAERKKPTGAQVWYIHVHRNDQVGPGHIFGNFTVYYTPEHVSTRIRKGSFLRMWSIEESKGTILNSPLSGDGYRPDPWMQVSPADSPFSETVELPEKTMWPFWKPAGFEDAEVVEIVDLARSAIQQPPPGSLGTNTC